MSRPERGWIVSGADEAKPAQHPAYVDVRRYPDRETSAAAYAQVARILEQDADEYHAVLRDILKQEVAELSAVRLRLAPDYAWHVAVLGDRPPRHLQSEVEQALGMGARVSLDAEAVVYLNARRSTTRKPGRQFVEVHHPSPGAPVWLQASL